MEIFEIRNLTFSYPESDGAALQNISLTVESGSFFIICGSSGSGKSTLLRHLKTVLSPHGKRTGEIFFNGNLLNETDDRTQAQKIGFVSQSPDNQIVTDKVWHELAFGLENLGYSTPEIRGRVAEMAAFFGIEKWFHKNVNELSGGQKQLLNLAAVMVTDPDVIILDEPASQLDPIAAAEFFNVLKKINDELGVTIILTEHRLDEVFHLADNVAVMEGGRLICSGSPKEVGKKLRDSESGMFLAMPAPMRIWAAVSSESECPLTVAEGRKWLDRFAENHDIAPVKKRYIPECSGDVTVKISEAWFSYERNGADIIRGLDITAHRGEFLAILGGNGAGKTTTLRLISGLEKPYRGEVSVNGKISFLPQNPQTLFSKKTVMGELEEMMKFIPEENRKEKLSYIISLCDLAELLDRHPYDISGGEQQRTALAKILMTDADIILLDEPTKGLDAEFKELFGEIINNLTEREMTVIMVSHDVEFCAEYAHRCAMFFDGSIVTSGTPDRFFSGNNFYTTSANRMARNALPEAITVDEVTESCGGKVYRKNRGGGIVPHNVEKKKIAEEGTGELPFWRKIIAAVSGLAAFSGFIYAAKNTDISASIDKGGLTEIGETQLKIYIFLISSFIICAISLYRKKPEKKNVRIERRRIPKRTAAASTLIMLLIPLTLYVGICYIGVRRYYAISLAILVECMIPFFMIFEGRKPQARELVIIATLCAIGIAGRTAFFMVPQFKPVAAIVIISGIAFGGESGFLVGAVTMLASNIIFSQGAWTPFQMFAMGIIGFLAGIFFNNGLIRRTKISICVFGAISVIVIYGGIMNPVSALIWGGEMLNGKMIMTYYVTGFPADAVHAAATAIFLWFTAEPMIEKLDRVKVRYGLIEKEKP